MDKQVSLTVIVVCFFLIVRCIWLCAIRMKYLERAADRIRQQSGLDRGEKHALMEECYTAIWGVVRSLLSFWVWRLDKMVKNRAKFEEVMTSEQ